MADTARRVWRKSTHCDSAACIEVARMQPMVAMRDGKDPGGPLLTFEVKQWRAFVRAICDREL
jgi:hypothetical protein